MPFFLIFIVTESSDGESQENALWITGDATKLKVPLVSILLTIMLIR